MPNFEHKRWWSERCLVFRQSEFPEVAGQKKWQSIFSKMTDFALFTALKLKIDIALHESFEQFRVLFFDIRYLSKKWGEVSFLWMWTARDSEWVIGFKNRSALWIGIKVGFHFSQMRQNFCMGTRILCYAALKRCIRYRLACVYSTHQELARRAASRHAAPLRKRQRGTVVWRCGLTAWRRDGAPISVQTFYGFFPLRSFLGSVAQWFGGSDFEKSAARRGHRFYRWREQLFWGPRSFDRAAMHSIIKPFQSSTREGIKLLFKKKTESPFRPPLAHC